MWRHQSEGRPACWLSTTADHGASRSTPTNSAAVVPNASACGAVEAPGVITGTACPRYANQGGAAALPQRLSGSRSSPSDCRAVPSSSCWEDPASDTRLVPMQPPPPPPPAPAPPRHVTLAARADALERYRSKKARRSAFKVIRYERRKINADRRPRIKGRFVKKGELARMVNDGTVTEAELAAAFGTAPVATRGPLPPSHTSTPSPQTATPAAAWGKQAAAPPAPARRRHLAADDRALTDAVGASAAAEVPLLMGGLPWDTHPPLCGGPSCHFDSLEVPAAVAEDPIGFGDGAADDFFGLAEALGLFC